MKTKNKKVSKLPSYLLYRRILKEGQRLVALDSENFLDILMNYAWKLTTLIIHRNVKVTSKLKVFYQFGKYLVFLNKKHGSIFVAKYLKAALLAIQRRIAGSPVKSLREIEPDLPLPRLSSSGLPAWIGSRDRRAILSLSLSVVQFYLTIYSLHRIIEAPVKAKIETITAPFSGSLSFLEGSLGYYEFSFRKLIRIPTINLRGPKGRDVVLLQLMTTSSSNSEFSWKGWAFDAYLIRNNPAMYSLVRKWLELTSNFDLLSILNMSRLRPSCEGIREDPSLGRLSFKEEAAGKLRVFAMVDSWTQSIMKPLHDLLFKLLASIPNDATFNQDAAFKRAISKGEKYGHSYGFDLSAATDRLPLILQIKILSGIIGGHLASLWGLILTARSYTLPANKKYNLEGDKLVYAVGQPMGALSSWAMLALTHHAIVQYAYSLIGGRGWTEAYEVLGDDIVIFSPPLASKYVELMSLYGVDLNMSKSVISHGKQPTVEFAKRTSLKGKDVSPLSMKMFLNQDSFAGKLSIFSWWASRVRDQLIPAFRVIMKSKRWDDRPCNSRFALLGLLSLSVSSGAIPFEWVLRELKNTRAYFKKSKSLFITDFDSKWGYAISKAVLQGEDISKFEPRDSNAYMFEQRWYKVAVIRRIESLVKKYNSVDPYDMKRRILRSIGSYSTFLSDMKYLPSKSITWIRCIDGKVFPSISHVSDLIDGEFKILYQRGFWSGSAERGYLIYHALNPDNLQSKKPIKTLKFKVKKISYLTFEAYFKNNPHFSDFRWSGQFVNHLWFTYLDGILANPYLTLRFYGNMELSKYSLKILLGFLQEVESAASVLSAFSQVKREPKVLEDNLTLVQFIEKTITDGFRDSSENQKLALYSSWTEVSDIGARELPKKRVNATTKVDTMWLGTTMGNPEPKEMPILNEQQQMMTFGKVLKPDPISKPFDEELKSKEAVVHSEERDYPKFNWGSYLLFVIFWWWLLSQSPEEDNIKEIFLDDSQESPKIIRYPSIQIYCAQLLFILLILFIFLYIPIQWNEITVSTGLDPNIVISNSPHELSDFRFPTMLELIEWRSRVEPTVSIIRSPEIGHGWSEPWSFNETWPDWLR